MIVCLPQTRTQNILHNEIDDLEKVHFYALQSYSFNFVAKWAAQNVCDSI